MQDEHAIFDQKMVKIINEVKANMQTVRLNIEQNLDKSEVHIANLNDYIDYYNEMLNKMFQQTQDVEVKLQN